MPTWLVVEDEPDIHDVIIAMFEVWGINGIPLVDGGEAVDWIEQVNTGAFNRELPELALVDIRLPGCSGIEVSQHLRESNHLANIPIILMTAYQLKPNEVEQTMAQSQADTLIFKPLPALNELRKLIESVITLRQKATPNA